MAATKTGTDRRKPTEFSSAFLCLVMTNLLDHIPRTPLLDPVDDWPKSVTRKQWSETMRRLVQNTIDEMDLEIDAEVIDRIRINSWLHVAEILTFRFVYSFIRFA